MSRITIQCLIAAVLLLPSTAWSISFDQAVKSADPTAKYLVYLHGAILETKGKNATSPRYGTYRYDDIVKHFEDRGLVVVEEVRGKVDPNRYASRVVKQVRRLTARGVPSANITVAGFSKGGFITLLVASSMNDADMKFVILAGCGRGNTARSFERFLKSRRGSRLKGHLFSLYATSDLEAGSCTPAIEQAKGQGLTFQETRIKDNRGHGVFYAPLPRWINPVALFAKGGK